MIWLGFQFMLGAFLFCVSFGVLVLGILIGIRSYSDWDYKRNKDKKC